MSDDLDLTPDPLAPADAGASDLVAIEGLLGEGPDTNAVRLYLDLGFHTYYDIPRESVVRRERVPAARSAFGVDASLLLVRRDTSLVVHRVSSRSVESEFLAGDFTAPGSFSTASATGARAAQPMHIPSYTIHGYVCCASPTSGCFALADTGGGHPTGGGPCTLAPRQPCWC